jgi:hypothetical protein
MGLRENLLLDRCRPSLLFPGVVPGKEVGAMSHAPGHLRDAFYDSVEDGMPDEVAAEGPRHDFYDGQPRSRRWLFGQLWHCSDIMPWELCDLLEMPQGSTYASAVQAIRREENVKRLSS